MLPPYSPAQTMSGRDRIIRALNGQKTDVIPAVPAYLCLFLADFRQAFYAAQYHERLRAEGARRCRVDHAEDTLFRSRALVQSYGIFKVQPDWIEVGRGMSRAWAERLEVIEQDGQLYFEDLHSGKKAWLRRARFLDGSAGLSDVNPSERDVLDLSAEIRDQEDVERLIPIRSAEEILQSGEMDLVRRVAADYGERWFITTILDTPFSTVADDLGFFGLMTTVHDRPHLLHALLERRLWQAQQEMHALALCGLHGVYVEEVFTGTDLISPRTYEAFVLDYNRPYFRHMRGLGLLPIHYVCGDALPRLEQMAGCDIAAVAVEESKKNVRIEIEEVVRRVGSRVAVLGNIDAVHFGLHASPEEMAAEVRRQAQIGAQTKGFIVSTGSPFPLDSNPRQVDALVMAAHSLPG